MKKILFVANTDMHIKLCYLPYIEYLKKQKYTVDVATNKKVHFDYIDKTIQIPIHRHPFHLGNIISIYKLKKVIEKEHYDLISCSTPMGSVIARLASQKARKKYHTKILYTAHGFHFFKGCSRFKYILYYIIEKILSRYTDMLVTINKEDYDFAKKHFSMDIRFIQGIGYNEDKLSYTLTEKEKVDFKKKLKLNSNDYVILYIAEYSKRKRQKYLLKVFSEMPNENMKLLLVGNNHLHHKMYSYIKKYKIEDKVKILGFRDDISNLLDIANLVISTSNQEGLPLNIMEAMHKEKPIVVTDCRGNRDLIKHQQNGLVVPINNKKALQDAIIYCKTNPEQAKKLGQKNAKIVQQYSIKTILPKYTKIYHELLKGDTDETYMV